jgi:hypothetical protein
LGQEDFAVQLRRRSSWRLLWWWLSKLSSRFLSMPVRRTSFRRTPSLGGWWRIPSAVGPVRSASRLGCWASTIRWPGLAVVTSLWQSAVRQIPCQTRQDFRSEAGHRQGGQAIRHRLLAGGHLRGRSSWVHGGCCQAAQGHSPQDLETVGSGCRCRHGRRAARSVSRPHRRGGVHTFG